MSTENENGKEFVEQQKSQDNNSESDILTKQLLEEDESQDVPETKTEQPTKSQDGKKKENAQPETKSEDAEVVIYEDELEELKSLGYEESDFDEFKREDIDNILQTKTEKPKSTEKPEEKTIPQSIVITQEMVDASGGGILKSFIGKPLSELATAMAKQNEAIQKRDVELKKLKNETTQNIEKQADEILKKIQDPDSKITEEEFNVLLKEYGELRKQAGYESAKVEVSPSEQEAEAFNQLQVRLDERLPETKVDARKAFETWWGTLDKTDREIYAKSDARTIENALITHLELENKKAEIARLKSETETKDKNGEAKARELAAEKARKALGAVKDKSVLNYKILPRTTGVKQDSETDVMVKELLEDD